jgi:hypothetical protein
VVALVVVGVVGIAFLIRLAADAVAPEGVATFLWTKLALTAAMVGWTAVIVMVDDGRGESESVIAAATGGLPWMAGLVGTRARAGSRRLPWLLRDGFAPSAAWMVALMVATGLPLWAMSGNDEPAWLAARLAVFFLEASALARLLHALADRRRADGALYLVLWILVATLMAGLGALVAALYAVRVVVPWAVGAVLPVALGYGSYQHNVGWELFPLLVSAGAIALARVREGSDVD